MHTILKSTHEFRAPSEPQVQTPKSWKMDPVSLRDWSLIAQPVAELSLLHPRDPAGHNKIRSVATEDTLGMRYALGCQMSRHGPQHMPFSGGVIFVERLHSGTAAVEFPDCNYMHSPGTITITDFKQPFRSSQHHTVGEALVLPREALGLADIAPFEPIFVPVDSVRGNLIAGEINRFFETALAGRAFDRSVLTTSIREAMNEAWTSNSDREEWWHGRRKLIHKYIETHLDDPNLGPLQICDLFNMSRAILYRMFERDAGVRRFIQDRRLYCAMWDLALSGVRRGRLSQVAERWGFSSDANFNRAVKLAFGMPPGSLFKKSLHRILEHADIVSGGRPPTNDPTAKWFRDENRGASDANAPFG